MKQKQHKLRCNDVSHGVILLLKNLVVQEDNVYNLTQH